MSGPLFDAEGEIRDAERMLKSVNEYLKLKFSDFSGRRADEVLGIGSSVIPENLTDEYSYDNNKRNYLLGRKSLEEDEEREFKECDKRLEECLKKAQDYVRRELPKFEDLVKQNSDKVSEIRKYCREDRESREDTIGIALESYKHFILGVSRKLSQSSKYLNWKEALDTPEKFKANISKYLYREKYENKPSSVDVCQSDIGSCTILANLIGLAKTNPGFIKHTLIDENKGKVIVRFHTNLKNPISVNRRPLDYNIFKKYLPGCTHKAAWPLIVECAYMQIIEPNLKSPLNKDGIGLLPDEVQFYLTGKPVKRETDSDFKSSDKYQKLEKILKEHKYAVVDFSIVFDVDERRDIGIYENHAYCLLGVTKEGDKEYVVLQNPHGKVTMIMPTCYYGSHDKNLPEFKSLRDIESKSKIVKEFKMPLNKFFEFCPSIFYFNSQQEAKKALEKGVEESK